MDRDIFEDKKYEREAETETGRERALKAENVKEEKGRKCRTLTLENLRRRKTRFQKFYSGNEEYQLKGCTRISASCN